MSNPGNKRLQRAKYGSSPSATEGETVTTTYRSNGREYTVTRQTGSVLNNGGNMEMGTFPTVGVPLPFLLKLSACCKPGAAVSINNVANEDVASVTPLVRAQAQVNAVTGLPASNALTNANNARQTLVTARSTTATALANLNAATTLLAVNTAQGLLDTARAAEDTALAAYNTAVAREAASRTAAAYIANQNATTLAAWLAAEL